MWIGNTVYYNSDKDGKFNLYAYDTTSSNKTTQVTKNRDWDIPLAKLRQSGTHYLRTRWRAGDHGCWF
ncbi:MAG: hypothetical protein IPK98_03235 [Chloracidobacterium sp.]|nr:hypothetical protein [Chloracidobacterium sp.]